MLALTTSARGALQASLQTGPKQTHNLNPTTLNHTECMALCWLSPAACEPFSVAPLLSGGQGPVFFAQGCPHMSVRTRPHMSVRTRPHMSVRTRPHMSVRTRPHMSPCDSHMHVHVLQHMIQLERLAHVLERLYTCWNGCTHASLHDPVQQQLCVQARREGVHGTTRPAGRACRRAEGVHVHGATRPGVHADVRRVGGGVLGAPWRQAQGQARTSHGCAHRDTHARTWQRARGHVRWFHTGACEAEAP